jgi:transketolase
VGALRYQGASFSDSKRRVDVVDEAAVRRKAYEIREKTLRVIRAGNAGHVGGDMSEADILTVLFYHVLRCDPKNPGRPDRDRYVQSKGHCVETYLTILGDRGFFPESDLDAYSHFGTKYIGHPHNGVPGIEICSGALGHGFSVGVGMALGAKMDGLANHTYVLLGDGELAEGSVWEAAMAAVNFRLDNLTAIVDRNRLQISGDTEEVMRLEPLRTKWEAFGFRVLEIDGHDYRQIYDALTCRQPGVPVLVLAHTVKGKGISFMENNAKWHHGVPDAGQFETAVRELAEVGRA